MQVYLLCELLAPLSCDERTIAKEAAVAAISTYLCVCADDLALDVCLVCDDAPVQALSAEIVDAISTSGSVPTSTF